MMCRARLAGGDADPRAGLLFPGGDAVSAGDALDGALSVDDALACMRRR